MEDAAAIQAFSDNARHILAGQIRRDFPYMDHAAVNRTVEQAMSNITNGLQRAMSQMATSKSRINFLSLPPEVRNRIYHFVLFSDEPRPRVVFREPKRGAKRVKIPISANTPFPKLLHTSREIREEAIGIFLNRLVITVYAAIYLDGPEPSSARCESDQMPLSKSWIGGLGNKARYIKKFSLRVEGLRYVRRRWTPRDLVLRGTNDEVLSDLGFSELGMQKNAMILCVPVIMRRSSAGLWMERSDLGILF